MKQLRIIFTILCALCLLAIAPLGMLFGLEAFLVCGVAAGFFFLLMLLCKQRQEIQEERNYTPSLQDTPPANEEKDETQP